MSLGEIKKHASSFIQDKYKTALLALTDVSPAQLLTEEATNADPWGPDARTMTKISEAAFETDDCCGIVDVLHKRLQSVYWKEWRQSYKSLVLLEFLLTHGPEDLFEEFHGDMHVIQELGKFNYLDEKGFDWGACMQKKSENILNLLGDEKQLKEARRKALKISKEIKGFGNLIVSPSSSSSSSPTSSKASKTSSLGSFSCDSPTWSREEHVTEDQHQRTNDKAKGSQQEPRKKCVINKEVDGSHLWSTSPIKEDGNFVAPTKGNEGNNSNGWYMAICSRIMGAANQTTPNGRIVGLRSLSDVGKMTKKKISRQLSLGS